MYVLGGRHLEEVMDSCEMYDLRTNEWSEFTALPRRLYGCQGVMADGVMYVTGGMDETSSITDEVWVSVETYLNGVSYLQ